MVMDEGLAMARYAYYGISTAADEEEAERMPDTLESITIELSPKELAYIIALIKPSLKAAGNWIDEEDGGWIDGEGIEKLRAEVDYYKALLRRLESKNTPTGAEVSE